MSLPGRGLAGTQQLEELRCPVWSDKGDVSGGPVLATQSVHKPQGSPFRRPLCLLQSRRENPGSLLRGQEFNPLLRGRGWEASLALLWAEQSRSPGLPECF